MRLSLNRIHENADGSFIVLELNLCSVYVLIAARKEEEEPMYKPDLPMTSPQVYAPRKPDGTWQNLLSHLHLESHESVL